MKKTMLQPLSGIRIAALWPLLMIALGAAPLMAQDLEGRLIFRQVDDGSDGIYLHDFATSSTSLLVDDADWASVSPDQMQLAFNRRVATDTMEIWIAELDGSDDRLVATITGDNLNFYGWSPSGTRLIFGRRSGGSCTKSLYSVDLQGGDEQLFFDPAHAEGDVDVYGACFDATGQTMYWASQDGCWSPTLEIYKADMVGDAVDIASIQRLTDNDVYDDLSRSNAIGGGNLAFWRAVGHPYNGDNLEIFVMNEDGTDPGQITDNDYPDHTGMISPNGAYIIWASKPGDSIDIVGMPLSWGEQFTLFDSTADERPIAWLPPLPTTLSGRLIYSSSDADGNRFYLHDFDDGTTDLLFEDAIGVSVSPDDRQIAFGRRIDTTTMEIWEAYLNGSHPRLVTTINGGNLRFYGWSPSGERLIFGRQSGGSCTTSMYSVNRWGADEQLFFDPVHAEGDVDVYGACFDATGQTMYWASQDGCWSPTLEIYKAAMIGDTVDVTSIQRLTDNDVYDDLRSSDAVRGGKVAFWRAVGHSYSGDFFEIFVMNEDGTDQIQLTDNSYRDSHGVFSPDGKTLLWAAWEGDDADILGAATDGSAPFALFGSSESEVPYAWLPPALPPHELSGSLFYMAQDGDETNLHLMNLDLGTSAFLAGDVDRASVSPDQTQLAYSRRIDNTTLEIWTMNVNRTENRQVITLTGGNLRFYGWSPSGDRLIFGRQSGGSCTTSMYSVDLQGGDEQLFFDPVHAEGDVDVYGACFDATGQTMYWASQDGCWSPTLEIYKADMVGDAVDIASIQRLTDNSAYEDLLRSNAIGGGKVAFWRAVGHSHSGDHFEIFMMNDDGTEQVQLTDNSYRDSHAIISPDGDVVLWAAWEGGDADIVFANHDNGIRFALIESANNEWPVAWIGTNITSVDPAPEPDLPSRTVSLGHPHPNPFNPATTVSYKLARAGQVSITIYDVSGRMVAELVNGHHAAGNHRVTWRGQDTQGRIVSAGTYLVRMITDGHIESRKMMLIK